MKKTILSLALLGAFIMPQSAFAWTYNGLSSLNPFTLFGTRTNKCQKCQNIEQPKCNSCQKVIPQNRCTKAFNTESECPCNKSH